MQEASREAINAAFSREAVSLVSVEGCVDTCMSKVGLQPVFLSFLSTPLGFTRWTLGATYVHLLLAGDHSPLSIALPSAVSDSGISSVSLHISTATKRVKCFIEHILHIVPGVRTHNLRAGPNNKTFYIHSPRFRLHTARSLASLSARH